MLKIDTFLWNVVYLYIVRKMSLTNWLPYYFYKNKDIIKISITNKSISKFDVTSKTRRVEQEIYTPSDIKTFYIIS